VEPQRTGYPNSRAQKPHGRTDKYRRRGH